MSAEERHSPRRVESPAGSVESETVHRVSDWLGSHGYPQVSDMVLGLISDYEPTCHKPCCTERAETTASHKASS